MENLGDIFGEMGIVNETVRSASVIAMEESVCLAANASHIESLTGKDKHAFGYVLYRLFAQILADRLRLTNKELVKVKGEGEGIKFEWK